MTIIASNDTFIVEFNGSKTWLLSYIDGDCLGHFPTARRAMNAFKKHSYISGAV